jgi:secondary thiamine-phosphate synthase enzyme
MIKHKTITINTTKNTEFVDISDSVADFVKESGIKNGIVNVQIMHTTAGLLVNENEPLLFKDLASHFERISPEGIGYHHDNIVVRTVNVCHDECANGHAHCRACHLAANVAINLIDGKLQLGQWQRVLFVELDRARERRYQIMVVGEQ